MSRVTIILEQCIHPTEGPCRVHGRECLSQIHASQTGMGISPGKAGVGEGMGRKQGGEVWGWGHRGEAVRPMRADAHPPSFTLVLYGLFGICHCSLHKAHWLVHVVLNTVNHGSLCPRGRGEGDKRQAREKARDGKVGSPLRAAKSLTFRAWPLYFTARFVSSRAFSTWSTVCMTFNSMLSNISPCKEQTRVTPKTPTLDRHCEKDRILLLVVFRVMKRSQPLGMWSHVDIFFLISCRFPDLDGGHSFEKVNQKIESLLGGRHQARCLWVSLDT